MLVLLFLDLCKMVRVDDLEILFLFKEDDSEFKIRLLEGGGYGSV